MLKVCHIISGDLWAGAEVMAWSLIRQIHRGEETNLQLLVLNNGKLATELRALGLPVTVLDEKRFPFPQLLKHVHSFIKHQSPHIIHSHRYKENILAFLGRGSKSRIRLVATQHGMPEGIIPGRWSPARLIAKLNRYLLANQFNRMVAVSQDIKRNFIQFGFSPDRISVIYNGIEVPEGFSPTEKGPSTVVGSAGRFFPVKDYPLMVRIARRALNKCNSLKFELAGDGPHRPMIERLISDFAINSSFCLKGHLDDMRSFYSHLDIYLNTSVHEGIPMSILEAMARGLPVVAPKVGGISEIIDDGIEGFLIADRSPRAFAEKILLLAQNRDLCRRMGLAAREKVKRQFSAQAMAERYLQLYDNIIHNLDMSESVYRV